MKSINKSEFIDRRNFIATRIEQIQAKVLELNKQMEELKEEAKKRVEDLEQRSVGIQAHLKQYQDNLVSLVTDRLKVEGIIELLNERAIESITFSEDHTDSSGVSDLT